MGPQMRPGHRSRGGGQLNQPKTPVYGRSPGPPARRRGHRHAAPPTIQAPAVTPPPAAVTLRSAAVTPRSKAVTLPLHAVTLRSLAVTPQPAAVTPRSHAVTLPLTAVTLRSRAVTLLPTGVTLRPPGVTLPFPAVTRTAIVPRLSAAYGIRNVVRATSLSVCVTLT